MGSLSRPAGGGRGGLRVVGGCVDVDVVAGGYEFMARLNREAAEDEAKKNREIEAAREKADEQARLAAILKANERNIDAFIQEGLSSRQHPNT